jgi:hypothetical protein
MQFECKETINEQPDILQEFLEYRESAKLLNMDLPIRYESIPPTRKSKYSIAECSHCKGLNAFENPLPKNCCRVCDWCEREF